jgi:hypothetical protein
MRSRPEPGVLARFPQGVTRQRRRELQVHRGCPPENEPNPVQMVHHHGRWQSALQPALDQAYQCPRWVVCHEHRRSKRRCVTIREMKEGPSGSAIRSLIPSHRKLLWTKSMVVSIAETSGRRSRQARSREANASEPSMNCRKEIRRCQNRGLTLPPGSARAMS